MIKKYIKKDKDGKILSVYQGVQNGNDQEVDLISQYKVGDNISDYENDNTRKLVTAYNKKDKSAIQDAPSKIDTIKYTLIEPKEFEYWDDQSDTWVLNQQEKSKASLASLRAAISAKIDKEANKVRTTPAGKTYQFDHILSATKYAIIDNDLKDISIKLLEWNERCWAKAREVESDILSGKIGVPTLKEAIAMLPTFTE